MTVVVEVVQVAACGICAKRVRRWCTIAVHLGLTDGLDVGFGVVFV